MEEEEVVGEEGVMDSLDEPVVRRRHPLPFLGRCNTNDNNNADSKLQSQASELPFHHHPLFINYYRIMTHLFPCSDVSDERERDREHERKRENLRLLILVAAVMVV